MHIYMVRHGQSKDNAHKLVSGDRETELTELGKRQAKQAGKKAKDLDIDVIICSPLARAQQTAKIIADELDIPESRIITLHDLRERDLGDLEGRSYAKNERLNGNFPAVEHIRGVEPLDYFHARVQNGLRQVLHEHSTKNVLIVAHFIVGRMLRVVVGGRKAHAIYDEARLENGVIYPLI
jgi:uncharacterized phosphatase